MTSCVRVQPVLGDEPVIREMLRDQRFSNFKQITILPSCFVVEFADAATADSFARQCHGMSVMGKCLNVVVHTENGDDNTCAPRKTVAVLGCPAVELTERKMYELFWRCGYLKDIEVDKRVGVAYLQFDNGEDAARAVASRSTINGTTLTVEYSSDRALNMPRLIVPVRRIGLAEPEDLCHEFQEEIRRVL